MDSPTCNNNVEIQKYIQQAERKREYNKSYYQTKTKLKRETTKQELDFLRERCEKLEAELFKLQNNNYDDNFRNLTNENSCLSEQVITLTQDNVNIRTLLEATRQRNLDLMMKKAADILPPVQNLSLS